MKILVVDDDTDSRTAISWFLRDQEHDVTECSDAEHAFTLASTQDYPMVLTDINMSHMSGVDLLKAISALPDSWRTDVVLFTGYGDMKSAIEALRAGAYDYLLKPIDARELALVVARVAEHQALVRENRHLSKYLDAQVKAATRDAEQELSRVRKLLAKTTLGNVAFFSEAMRLAFEAARQYHADRSLPVLIQGETGTGKEIIARSIHYGDNDTQTGTGPFIDINCAAIAPNLFESELFGYEAGAFTGGLARGQKGKLDSACGGTLFLDEVGEMPPEMQAKLLRFLQEGEYYRVGGLKKIKADVRVICATNVDLTKQMEKGTFRRDLYYRLKVGHIVLKPLRERREEILPLANMFLNEFSCQRKKLFTAISAEASKLLAEYSWPGNVRELKNMIECIVFMHNDYEIECHHIEPLLQESLSCRTKAKHYIVETGNNTLILPMPPGGYSLKEYNELIIDKVLTAHNGNQTMTARYLGMSLRALCYRLEHMQERIKRN